MPRHRRPPGPPARRLTPGERDDLLARLRRGFGPVQARDEAGVSRHRLIREKKADPEFAAAIKSAEAERRQFRRDRAYALALAGNRDALLLVVPHAATADRADEWSLDDWLNTDGRDKPPGEHDRFEKVVTTWQRTWDAVFRLALTLAGASLMDLIPEDARATARDRLAKLKPGDSVG